MYRLAAFIFSTLLCASTGLAQSPSETLRAIPFCATDGQTGPEILEKVKAEGWLQIPKKNMPVVALRMGDTTYYRAIDNSLDGDLFAKRRAHAKTMYAWGDGSTLIGARVGGVFTFNANKRSDGVTELRCDLFFAATETSDGLFEQWGASTDASGVKTAEFKEIDRKGKRNTIYETTYKLTRYSLPEGTKPRQTWTDYMLIITYERSR